MKNKPKQVFLIDGNNLFYRSFFAPFKDLSVTCADCRGTGDCGDCPTCKGTGSEPTKATYLTLNAILSLIKDYNPTYLLIAFDGRRENLSRVRLYPEYKGNRPSERPIGVTPQLRRLKQILKLVGIPTLTAKGYEADDILGAAAHRYATSLLEAIIVSTDKDLAQACSNENVFILHPATRTWLSNITAGKKYGIRTSQLLDYFILLGDATDNLPGIKGFGKKSAAGYLNKYGNMPGMLNAARLGLIPAKLGRNLLDASESGWLGLAKALFALDYGVYAPPLASLKLNLDLSGAKDIFNTLKFKNME